MKKIFTHLFALFLLSFVTTSNVWAETIELDPSAGTFSGGNSSYCNTWTSTSEPVVTFSVAVNNMTVGAVGGGFGIARGQNADSNWTFSVAGYKILSYSFYYKLQDNSAATDIVITVNNEAHTVTTTSQLLEVNDVNASAASFTLSGTNETIILTDVAIEAEPILENGAVYRFVCSGTTTVSLGASALTDVAAVSTSETEKAQQWYVTVSDNNYTFRNLANGRYLLGNNNTSGGWALTEASNNFTVTEVNGNYAIRGASHSNGYGYMHKDGSNNIVSWESGAANSQWTPIEVSYTAEQLAAVWEEVEALVVPSTTVDTYEGYLDVLFSDKSCVTPKLATLDAAKATDAYNNLPVTLQKMVDKVYGGDWAEATVAPDDRPNGNSNTNHDLWDVADTWDNDYAKKFRVQMYEPYSVEGEVTSYLRINAHCNMDNPTGIYANAGEPMYIMVEGTIAEGAELWVAHQVGHGATMYYNNVAYTQLHEGLNVVPYFADGSQLWINYVVHTYNADGTTIAEKFPENRQLSKYKPLKIHIEGGKINGFFNAMGDYRATTDAENLWGEVDNDADWNYYKARVALSGDFALLGHRQTLLFDFGKYNSDKGHFGVENADGGIEYALAYHLEKIEVPATPNCYVGSGTGFGNYSDTYYPGMNLVTENGTPNKVNIMLEAWDRIQYSEHASLGLLSVANINKMNALYPRWTTAGEAAEIYNYGAATINNVTQTYQQFCQGIDYSEYFNHHGAAVGAGSGYMSGGWRVCNYHYNTMGSIIGKIAVEAGPTWGPAHEIGHQHQSIFNLNGQTEVTNNFHSNVAVWYMGMETSRYNGSEGNLEHVLAAYNTDGNDLYTNNIWALTHLYYRLWLYYHLAGNNTQFWPRLFELLRQVPIVNGGQISGETSLLRFYQHACDAAGEDLTEFFRAHGFFELMTDRLVGDYSNGTYNVTEEQIETAISAVKAKSYPNNYAIILINDGTIETTLKHDGVSKRDLWDNNPSAEYGSVTDFIEGNTDVTAYEATVSADGTVTMSGGTGGVGFLILNEKGEIVSFSNKATFQISDEAAYLLATGKASVVAVDAESETTESEVDLSAIQREMLLALINKVKAMPIDDGSYTHVGFYTKASATELLAALESAKTAYESGSGYGAAYEMLYAEKEKFVNSSNLSFVPFDPSLTYVITNCAYSDKTMHLDNGLKSATGVDQTAETAMWKFVETDTEGVYNLQSVSGNYLTAPAKSSTVGSSSLESDAATFTLLQESPVGAWSISLSPAAEYTTLHDNSYGNVVGWSAGVDPSKWYLTAVENNNLDESLVAADELQALITKTEALVDVVGMAIPCALQTTDNSAPFYLYCNANVTSGGDKSLPANGYNILDGNDETFLHTVYSGNSVDGLNHYLLLDLGEGNTLSTIQFYYKTRHNGDSKSHPQVIKVEGSNDKETFVEIETISSGLPSEYSAEYTSSELTNGNEYRYFRFMVTDTYGTKTDDNSHEYFYIAEFGIPSLPDVYTKIDAEYQAYVTETDMQTIYNAIVTAKTALESGTDLSTAKDDLQEAYDIFYALYKKPIDDKKTELKTLATATDAVIAQVGTVELGVETPIALTTSNLYCNQVDTNESGSGDTYITRLTDGDTGTYLHTTSTEGYLRIDLGENSTATAFKFSYTTRSNGNNRPTNIVVEGCNEQDGTYTTITELSEGLPSGNAAVYNSDIINMSQAYRYVRLRVTNAITNNANSKIFVMSEFSITTVKERNITIENAYVGIVSEDLLYSTYNTSGDSHLMAAETSNPTLAQLEAQITKLTDAKAALEAAMNQVNKTELVELIATAMTLYNKMSDDNGNMNADYATSSLTADQLTAVKDALDAAQSVVDYAGSTQLQVNDAKNALNEKYEVLVSVEDTNEKSTLATTGLTALISDVKTLLGTIATEAASSKVALPLTTTTGADYSITTAGVGDGSLANLIDKNADGTGNTGTYYGSLWQGGVEAYSQYIEVDLGSGIALDELSFDYTTRNSGHSTERPKVIKLLGSNDKSNYVEIKEFTDGMPVGQCQQWTMSEMLELAARYRYIRFSVDSDNHSFHMSDFNVYTNIDYAVADYYTTATDLDLVGLCVALQSAEDLLTRGYITTAQYEEVYNKLSSCYTAANNVVDADATTDARTELQALIAETETLLTEVAVINEESTVTLQATEASNPYYIWSNAPRTANPVSNLLLDDDSYFHSEWETSNNPPAESHYLAIDFGENNYIGAFTFNYTTVADTWSKSPTAITVQGAKTIDEFTTIAELTANADGLPNSESSEDYESKILNENGENYRYLRFVVTANRGGGTITVNENKYAYFQLSKFGITSQSAQIGIKDDYVSPNMPVSIVADAYNKQQEAEGVENTHYFSSTELAELQAELQAAYDALNAAKNLKDFPVTLTTDVNNPVLYKIQIKSNENVFTYKGETADASKKPVLAASELGNRYQAWYFMQGTNSESYEDILILPYFNEGEKNTTLRLSYANNNDGTDPAVVASGANTTDNWYITFTSEGDYVTTEGWWNLQPEGGSDVNAYVNQWGGNAATRLALWRNASNPSNNGSQFRFVLDETDYSLSDAYYALLNQYNSYSEIEGGTAIGTYTTESANAYMEKYNAAGALVEAKNATDDEYNAAREELVTAYVALVVNMPDPEKLYVLRCNHEDRYIYVNADNKLQWAASSYDKTQSRAIWQFEDIDASAGTCKMKSLHTQSYMQTVSSGNQVVFGTEGAVMTIAPSSSVDGAVIFEAGNNNIGLHAHGSENRVIGYGNGAGANHYFFEEVGEVANLHNDVTIKTSFSSVMLGYNATVPEGVEAYTATGIEEGYVTLVKVAEPEGVLPANTPVILYRPGLAELTTQTFVFNYTENEAVVADDVQTAIDSETICGSLFTSYVACEGNYDYYKLMIKTGEDAKMYWMYEEFDANGTYGTDNIYKNTNDGGHIKCSANKIYMRLPSAAQAASYGLRFKEIGTTGVEEVKTENGNVETIYDLTGRKLTEITESGFYIVNGQKRYVK